MHLGLYNWCKEGNSSEKSHNKWKNIDSPKLFVVDYQIERQRRDCSAEQVNFKGGKVDQNRLAHKQTNSKRANRKYARNDGASFMVQSAIYPYCASKVKVRDRLSNKTRDSAPSKLGFGST